MDESHFPQMRLLGIDAGTTTLSASLWEDGREADCLTLENDACLPPDMPGAALQNPVRIEALAENALSRFHDVDGIALTGQMHGILYTDRDGTALSPLYTWQDQRGAPLAEELSRECGCSLSAGYGLLTHAALVRAHSVPSGAAHLMTIMDYLALRLGGKCVMHISNAASLGGFDVRTGSFRAEALKAMNVSAALLPEMCDCAHQTGSYGGVPVFSAIGDNQASFLGAAGAEGVLLNLGTGGQISVYSSEYRDCHPCETRPLNGKACLLVGSLLCGGRAYAILENFLRQCGALSGGDSGSLYACMNRLAQEKITNLPIFEPMFCGSRAEPGRRAKLEGLTEENFTPEHLVQSLLWGIADEMYAWYQPLKLGVPARLFGSGNAIRRNVALQRMLTERFGSPLLLSDVREEAAFGAACLAAKCLKGEEI